METQMITGRSQPLDNLSIILMFKWHTEAVSFQRQSIFMKMHYEITISPRAHL